MTASRAGTQAYGSGRPAKLALGMWAGVGPTRVVHLANVCDADCIHFNDRSDRPFIHDICHVIVLSDHVARGTELLKQVAICSLMWLCAFEVAQASHTYRVVNV